MIGSSKAREQRIQPAIKFSSIIDVDRGQKRESVINRTSRRSETAATHAREVEPVKMYQSPCGSSRIVGT